MSQDADQLQEGINDKSSYSIRTYVEVAHHGDGNLFSELLHHTAWPQRIRLSKPRGSIPPCLRCGLVRTPGRPHRTRTNLSPCRHSYLSESPWSPLGRGLGVQSVLGRSKLHCSLFPRQTRQHDAGV